jgi:hypothetical protein
MSRKLAVLAMVVLVLLVAANPSLAAGGGPHGGPGGRGPGGQGGEGGRSLFALVGTITERGDDTVTVQVIEGNRFVWPYVGETVACPSPLLTSRRAIWPASTAR